MLKRKQLTQQGEEKMRTWNDEDDKTIAWVADENNVDADALSAYVSNIHHTTENIEDWGDVISDFNDSIFGYYDSREDFCWEIMSEMCADIPDWVVRHIDWDSVWNCELRHDFFEENGYYFRNI